MVKSRRARSCTTGALLAVTLGACAGASADAVQEKQAADVISVVDSMFPMEIMIERFQAEFPRVDAFGAGSAATRDELVARFIAAVQDSSAGALRRLRLDAAEFAWLYAPTSRMTAGPFRQPPHVGWMLVEQNGLKGEARVLRHYGGRDLQFRGYRCAAEPVTEGANRLHEECVLDLGIEPQPVRLFGTIVERDGRWKFVSIANRL